MLVRYSHLLVSFGSLITWVSCLDGDDGKGISVKIGLQEERKRKKMRERRNTHETHERKRI